jgi:hypothetical protein
MQQMKLNGDSGVSAKDQNADGNVDSKDYGPEIFRWKQRF